MLTADVEDRGAFGGMNPCEQPMATSKPRDEVAASPVGEAGR
jgi:hypothetical protein